MKDIVKGYLAAFISAVTYGMIPLFMIPIKQQGFSVDAALFYRFITTSLSTEKRHCALPRAKYLSFLF